MKNVHITLLVFFSTMYRKPQAQDAIYSMIREMAGQNASVK